MAVLKILTSPDPRLKQKAKPVTGVDAHIQKIMDDMLETMYHDNGIGLAAPQVGIDKRIIVLDVADKNNGEKPTPYQVANPEIIEVSKKEIPHQEGCLSVPGYYSEVVRPAQCTVKGLDRNNQEIIIKAEGWLAVCLQHEIDHLNGVLFVDHLSRLKKQTILKKLEKDKKTGRTSQTVL